MAFKQYQEYDVLTAAKERIEFSFNNFERLYVSFSGGKDSTVMLHLVMDEAKRRNRKVGVLIIDLEAQYKDTIIHIQKMVDEYREHIDLHWICAEMLLRNAVSNFDPRWICWDSEKKDVWVREMPKDAADLSQYDFYVPKMEFEEFMVIFGEWYSNYGEFTTGALVGIRSDESLHRYKAITSNKTGLMVQGRKETTKVGKNLYNIYPIYDWKTKDIWTYHGKFPEKGYNPVYHKMHMAGVKFSQQRLCQPYGDDQKRGLWLYHILEPETWYKIVARVNGVNSGSLYVKENGNMTGNHKVYKPEGHTWKTFCNLLLRTLPQQTQKHYLERFKKFISGWQDRGYETIPDEAPEDLEAQCWAPSWRRMCRCILRNDYWCKGLGQVQPKSEAYGKYLQIRNRKKKLGLR